MILPFVLTLARILLGLSLASYVVYSIISVFSARKWFHSTQPIDSQWTPSVTILKPICGMDAEAYDNFVSYCLQDYPSEHLQIIFGALDVDDPALSLAKQLKSEYRSLDISVVSGNTGLHRGTNRKVCNLLSMFPLAKHDLLVLCDSDMRVKPDYLRRIVSPFNTSVINSQAHPIGMVTCPYRGSRVMSFAAIMEALSIGADFIPSIFVSRKMEGVNFALGSTIVLPKEVLKKIGGFESLLDELADDFRLGSGAVKAGYSVELSDYMIDDVLGQESFEKMWSRRQRWARTLRMCRPAGYAGVFITQGVPLAFLFAVTYSFSAFGISVLAGIIALRFAVSLWITQRYTRDPNIARYLPLLPLSDLLSFTLYLGSYMGQNISWRGEQFRLLPDGKLRHIP